MFHAHPTRTLLILLAILLAVVAFAYALRLRFPSSRQVEQTSSIQNAFPANAPAPRPEDYIAAQKGFQYLVSYTDQGFAPPTLSVKKGETVRFTNNSNNTLQLSLIGANPLTRGQYFEYTFTTSAAVSDSATNAIQVTVE